MGRAQHVPWKIASRYEWAAKEENERAAAEQCLSRHNTNILAHVRSALRGKDIESALRIATRGSSAMLDTLPTRSWMRRAPPAGASEAADKNRAARGPLPAPPGVQSQRIAHHRDQGDDHDGRRQCSAGRRPFQRRGAEWTTEDDFDKTRNGQERASDHNSGH